MKARVKKWLMQPESASQRVAKNTGILYAKMGITIFISLYTTRLILNSLGASDFGIFNIVGGAIAMLGFLNNAMASATQRFMSYAEGEGNKEKQKSIFNVSIILHFLIAIIMAVVLLIAGYFFFNGILNISEDRIPAARMVYYFMIASTVLTIMTVPYDAVIYAHENMLYYAVVGIFESVLKLGVALTVVYTSADKLITYGLLMTCTSLFVMIVMRIYCHKKYKECTFAPKSFYNKSLMKEITGFSGWNLLGASSSMLLNYGQGIIVNMFFGTKVNAAQGIANQVNGQLRVLAGTMMTALKPVIVKSEGAGNRELMFRSIMTGSKMSFFLVMLPSIPVLIEMPYIFNFWLKNVPDFAIIFCRLLLIRSLIEFLFYPVSASIVAHGNIKKKEIVTSFFYYITLFAIYFLFKIGCPVYSLYFVLIILANIEAGIYLFFAWCYLKFPVLTFLKNLISKSICVFTIIFAVSLIPAILLNDTFYRLLLVTTISTIVFFVTVWFIGLDKNERLQIKQICTPYLSKLIIGKNKT